MIPYYLLVISAFVLVAADYLPDRRIRLLLFILFSVLLVLFAGLRAVGTDNDSISYENAYNSTAQLSWTEILAGDYEHSSMERGYTLFTKVLNGAGLPIWSVFLIMAVLAGTFNYSLIFRKSSFPFSSLLFYVCFFYFYRDFTQIRFAVSAGMGLHALFLFAEKKYGASVLLILLAACFHSAVLVLGLVFVAYRFIKSYLAFLLLPLAGMAGGIFNPVAFFFRIGGMPPALVSYVEAEEFGRGGYVASAISQLVLIAVFIFRRRLLREYPEPLIRLLYTALSIGSFINLLFINFSIMQRLSLLLFGVVMFLGMYVFRMLEKQPGERGMALALRVLFNVYVFYYGLKMIDPGLLQPYQLF